MLVLTIAGTVGKDGGVIRKTPSGDSVLDFSVAHNTGKDQAGNWNQSVWVRCSLWGKRAESLEQYINAGDKITVCGDLSVTEKDGRSYFNLRANQVELGGGGRREEQSAPRLESRPAPQKQARQSVPVDEDEIPF